MGGVSSSGGISPVAPPSDATRVGQKPPMSARCRRLLEDLRRQCPGAPAPPVPPGDIGAPVQVREDDLAKDMQRLLTDEGRHPAVVWTAPDSEVVAHGAKLRVSCLPAGLLLVGLSLESEQTGLQELTVPLALGSNQRTAGMLAVTERKPRGHVALVDRWGEAVIATVWQTLLEAAVAHAGALALDTFGEPLIPGALIVQPPRLEIIPQPRHAFDREPVA